MISNELSVEIILGKLLKFEKIYAINNFRDNSILRSKISNRNDDKNEKSINFKKKLKTDNDSIKLINLKLLAKDDEKG